MEKFCLKWNEFESNIGVAFRELREDKDFFDVTLACDDDQIQAHKLILSACSPFFRNVLRRNPHSNPLLYLKGVKQADLKAILDFMYHGEVNVAQENLNSFLAVAEDLKVKGLTQNPSAEKAPSSPSSRISKRPDIPPPPQNSSYTQSMQLHPQPELQHHPASQPPTKRPPCLPQTQTPLEESKTQENMDLVKSEPDDGGHVTNNSSSSLLLYQDCDEDVRLEDDEAGQYYDDAIRGHKQRLIEYVERVEEEGVVAYKCGICFKTSTRRDALTSHIENIHFPGAYKCYYCQLVFNSQNTRNVHIGRKHKFNSN